MLCLHLLTGTSKQWPSFLATQCYSLSPYKERSPWEILQVLADLEKKMKENQKSVLWLTSYWHMFASQRNNFIILGLENSLTVGSKDTERGGMWGTWLIRHWYMKMPFWKRQHAPPAAGSSFSVWCSPSAGELCVCTDVLQLFSLGTPRNSPGCLWGWLLLLGAWLGAAPVVCSGVGRVPWLPSWIRSRP